MPRFRKAWSVTSGGWRDGRGGRVGCVVGKVVGRVDNLIQEKNEEGVYDD